MEAAGGICISPVLESVANDIELLTIEERRRTAEETAMTLATKTFAKFASLSR